MKEDKLGEGGFYDELTNDVSEGSNIIDGKPSQKLPGKIIDNRFVGSL